MKDPDVDFGMILAAAAAAAAVDDAAACAIPDLVHEMRTALTIVSGWVDLEAGLRSVVSS